MFNVYQMSFAKYVNTHPIFSSVLYVIYIYMNVYQIHENISPLNSL